MNKVITIIFIFMCAPLLALAENYEPVSYDGKTTQHWLNVLTDEMFSSNNRISNDRENLIRLENNLRARIKLDSNNPALYFLLGRVKHAFLSMRVEEIRHLGRELALKDEQYIQLKKEITQNYKKALELDDAGHSVQLGGKMLGIIDSSIFSSDDMRIKALKKELKRPWGESEDFEYSTYSHLVTAYVDGKYYSEALLVIDEIEKKFPHMQSEIELGRKQIANYMKTAVDSSQQESEDKIESAESKKSETVTTMDEQQPVVKEKDEQQSYEDLLDLNNDRIFVISITLVLLFLVAFVAVRRKNKK